MHTANLSVFQEAALLCIPFLLRDITPSSIIPTSLMHCGGNVIGYWPIYMTLLSVVPIHVTTQSGVIVRCVSPYLWCQTK